MTNSQNIELSRTIKRLEMIKNLISLGEEDEISAHVSKLEQQNLSILLKEILFYLNQKSFSKAVIAIEIFINQHNALAIYTDTEIEGLRLEAKSLEAELNKLSYEKANLEKLIHEFGVRHNTELGELILKILRFRKLKSKGTSKEKETENDYNNYSREYEINKNEEIAELSQEEKVEIKKLYRKASKLCHPDVVNEEQKELADKVFAELNAAYESNDLVKVKEILESLEKGDFFISKSDVISEKQLMKIEIEKLRLRIKELITECQIIKESEAYKTVSGIDNWNEYFNSIKEKLVEQITELENGEQ